MKPIITVEYEGQTWSLYRKDIDGLSDKQILELLSPGFPGIANGQLTWKGTDKIVINKAVGKKGSSSLEDLLLSLPTDPLIEVVEKTNKLSEGIITLKDWEEYDKEFCWSRLEGELQTRQAIIANTIETLLSCQNEVVPWF